MRLMSVLAALLIAAGSAQAATVQPLASFSATATTEGFEGLGGSLANVPAPLSVTGGVFLGPDSSWTNGYAGGDNVLVFAPAAIDFGGALMTEVGFELGGDAPATVDVDLMRGGTSIFTTQIVLSAAVVSGAEPWGFYGFTDAAGIDAIQISATNGRDFFGLDNVIFSADAGPAPVPLPAGLPLLLAGLGALWTVRKARQA
ncbi:MAG: VPLPA-CTERM sorting domain-containing protein [Pseudomonadota bacterium]